MTVLRIVYASLRQSEDLIGSPWPLRPIVATFRWFVESNLNHVDASHPALALALPEAQS